MTFKKKDLINIDGAIRALLEGDSKSKKLVYALVKNSKVLEPEVTAIRKAYETETEGYKEYLQGLREIYNKYGAKDEQGNVKVTPTGFELANPDQREEVTNEIKELEDKYKDALEARQKEVEEYNKMLDEEIELNLVKIDFESLPEEINPEIIYVLDDIINEPKED